MAEMGSKRMVVILSHVVALQSNMSLAIWLHGLLLTWERTTYSRSSHSIFYSSIVRKNGAYHNPKYLQLHPVL